jgi:glycosyltransferase involved in cell wall biosynthesis
VNQNEITGLVVPPKNPRALADAIARLLNDDALRHKLGAAGKLRAAQNFTIEKMVDGVMRTYENALAKKIILPTAK